MPIVDVEAIAMSAALARVATRLLRGGHPPSASDPVFFSRCRLFCSLPPSADELPVPHWAAAEAEILRDIEPVVELVKDILHSGRYGDCGILSPDDEKVVVEKLLAYHPCSEDKIGCGLNAIMVDMHPEFRMSRCLFVVRTDGGREDFSYRKCLGAYIQGAYPSHADRFIRKHVVRRR